MPSQYHRLFASFQPDHDPGEIEQIVRQHCVSLSNLDVDTLKREAALAAAVIDSRLGAPAPGPISDGPPRAFELQGTPLSQFTLEHIEQFISHLPGSDPKATLTEATAAKNAHVAAHRKLLLARIAEEEAASAARKALAKVGEYIVARWSPEEIQAAERHLEADEQERQPPATPTPPAPDDDYRVSVTGKFGEYVFEEGATSSGYGFRILRDSQLWVDNAHALKGSRAIDVLAFEIHQEQAALAKLEEQLGPDDVGREMYQWAVRVQRELRQSAGCEVSVCGDKYTFRLPPAVGPEAFECTRHGEPWMIFQDQLVADSVRALVERLHDVRAATNVLEQYFGNIEQPSDDGAPTPG